MAEKTWDNFYREICGSKKLLEGNILENSPHITEIARYVSPGDSILEIGTGTGVLAAPLASAGIKVTSIDNNAEVLRMAGINARVLGVEIEYKEADAFKLPFANQEFKVSFSGGLLEHFNNEDIGRLIAEHQRVAEVVVVTVPIKGGNPVNYGDERWLTMEEWESLLKPMGVVKGFTYGHEPNGCFTFILASKQIPICQLSGLVLTKDSEDRIDRLLDSMRLFCDELVVVVDKSSRDRTLEICRGKADVCEVWPNPDGFREAIIETAHGICKGDWIIRLDDDELISEGIFVQKKKLAGVPWFYGCLALPRYDLYQDDKHYIKSAGWYPGPALRVFRKGAIYQKEVLIHEPPQVLNGALDVMVTPHIFHYRNLIKTRAEREKAWEWSLTKPHKGDPDWFRHFYLFEDFDFEVGEVQEIPLTAETYGGNK